MLSDQFPQPAADGVRVFRTEAGRAKADDAASGLRRIHVDRRGAVLQRNADVHAGHFEAALEREDEPGCRAAGADFGPGVAEGFTSPSKRSWRVCSFLAHLALPADPVRGVRPAGFYRSDSGLATIAQKARLHFPPDRQFL